MRVARWSNNLAVRLTPAVVEALTLKEGDDIEIHVAGDRASGSRGSRGARSFSPGLCAFRGRLPADWTFDRDEANAR